MKYAIVIVVFNFNFNFCFLFPQEVEGNVSAAVNAAVVGAAALLASETNRSVAQSVLDLAGPPDQPNSNPLANGWVFTNVLSSDAQEAVMAVYENQWGTGGKLPK